MCVMYVFCVTKISLNIVSAAALVAATSGNAIRSIHGAAISARARRVFLANSLPRSFTTKVTLHWSLHLRRTGWRRSLSHWFVDRQHSDVGMWSPRRPGRLWRERARAAATRAPPPAIFRPGAAIRSQLRFRIPRIASRCKCNAHGEMESRRAAGRLAASRMQT